MLFHGRVFSSFSFRTAAGPRQVHVHRGLSSSASTPERSKMQYLRRLLLPGGAAHFKFVGSPAVFRGPGNLLSVTQVITSTFQGEPIRIHCLPGYASALFLVEYPERHHFFLLDCGSPSDSPRIQFYMEEVLRHSIGSDGITMKENLKLAVATHCHIDHTGAALAYHQLGIPVTRPLFLDVAYCGSRGRMEQLFEASLLMYVGSCNGRALENPFVHSQGIVGPYWSCTYPSKSNLLDGSQLPCGFHDWVAVNIPGHTSHMVGIYHTPSRTFYASDLMVKLKKGLFPPRPVHFDWAYSHTLHRLRKLDVSCLLLAHGGVIDVKDQYGSWSHVIDEVAQNYREQREAVSSTAGRSFTKAFQTAVGATLKAISTEGRGYSQSDVEGGPVPQPIVHPYDVYILK